MVEECILQNFGGKMVTIKTTKISLSNTDNKAFYVNVNESYPLDKNLYLFKEGLITKNNASSLEQSIKLALELSKDLLLNKNTVSIHLLS